MYQRDIKYRERQRQANTYTSANEENILIYNKANNCHTKHANQRQLIERFKVTATCCE